LPSAHWYARALDHRAIAAEAVLTAVATGSWRGYYFFSNMNTENEMLLTLAVTDRTLSLPVVVVCVCVCARARASIAACSQHACRVVVVCATRR
jgi:hypothetical protein